MALTKERKAEYKLRNWHDLNDKKEIEFIGSYFR